MIVCQHDSNPYQFTVILESGDDGKVNDHNRPNGFTDEVTLFEECKILNEERSEQMLADVIVTGLLAQ